MITRLDLERALAEYREAIIAATLTAIEHPDRSIRDAFGYRDLMPNASNCARITALRQLVQVGRGCTEDIPVRTR